MAGAADDRIRKGADDEGASASATGGDPIGAAHPPSPAIAPALRRPALDAEMCAFGDKRVPRPAGAETRFCARASLWSRAAL
jgi:hypothetical protein